MDQDAFGSISSTEFDYSSNIELKQSLVTIWFCLIAELR